MQADAAACMQADVAGMLLPKRHAENNLVTQNAVRLAYCSFVVVPS